MATTTRTIKKTGMGQGELFDLLTSIVALVNELRDDHAVTKTLIDEIIVDFEAHTHNAAGNQAGSYFTSVPKTDAATVDNGTTRSVSATALETITAEEVSMSDH